LSPQPGASATAALASEPSPRIAGATTSCSRGQRRSDGLVQPGAVAAVAGLGALLLIGAFASSPTRPDSQEAAITAWLAGPQQAFDVLASKTSASVRASSSDLAAHPVRPHKPRARRHAARNIKHHSQARLQPAAPVAVSAPATTRSTNTSYPDRGLEITVASPRHRDLPPRIVAGACAGRRGSQQVPLALGASMTHIDTHTFLEELTQAREARETREERLRPLWQMTVPQRVAAMRRGELTYEQLAAWAGRHRDQVPEVNGEFEWIAAFTPEACE
jgi:hypothetical protein